MEAQMALFTFLRSRNIDEEYVVKLRDDKIDISIIESMEDNALAHYIPIYGDRIATRRFCSEYQRKGEKDAQRQSLLQKLRRKMGIEKTSEDRNEEPGPSTKQQRTYLKNNKMALRQTRKIELGWIHEGKQQRKKGGGGTRRLDVSKQSKKADLLQMALDLFFPNGKSKKGKLEEFSVDILDFQEDAVLDDNVTVGELYSVLKMGVLRFYLSTKSKDSTDTEYVEDAEFAELQDENASLSSSTSEVIIGAHGGEFIFLQLDDTVPVLTSDEEATEIDIAPTCSAPTDNVIVINANEPANEQGDALFLRASFSPSETSTPTTLNSNLTGYEITSVHIKVHRANLMDELIAQFTDPKLLTYPLKFCYIDEKGSDAAGVSRDIYSAFWTEFYDYATEGQDMRVPVLSPKRKEEEWKAIGRIMLKGFQDYGYFPCRLAQAFTVALLLGEKSVSPDLLFESFLLYMSKEDRDLVDKALQADLDDEEKDELIDFLDRMGVQTVPNKLKLKATLLSVAHKLIIQQPKYALDKLSEVVGPAFRKEVHSLDNIQQIYENVKPTTRKVLKLLDASPSTQPEHQSFRYLQQYIRGLDQSDLRKCLRFITGSDVICVDKIEVIFTSLDGVARRPVAHTCGPVLELPWTYLSFPELRVEFDHILSNNSCFVMDIA